LFFRFHRNDQFAALRQAAAFPASGNTNHCQHLAGVGCLAWCLLQDQQVCNSLTIAEQHGLPPPAVRGSGLPPPTSAWQRQAAGRAHLARGLGTGALVKAGAAANGRRRCSADGN